LERIGAAGGPTKVLTRPTARMAKRDHLWPELLPDGQAVLFTITAVTGASMPRRWPSWICEPGCVRSSCAAVVTRTTFQAGLARRCAPSARRHLVYAATARSGGLVRFVASGDARYARAGDSQVTTTNAGGVDAVVARNGTLAYVSGGNTLWAAAPRTLVWVDRQGRETPIPVPPRPYVFPRLSRDGTRSRCSPSIRRWTSGSWI